MFLKSTNVLILALINFQKRNTSDSRMQHSTLLKIRITGVFLFIYLLFQTASKAQEMFGVTLGNYSGANGIIINPATMTSSRNYLDINLFAGDFFIFNNAYYLPSADVSIYDIMKPGFEFPTYGEKQQNLLYYKNQKLKQATVNIRLQGPGAMYQYGKHAFGLTTAFRYFTSGTNIPWEMPVFGYESLSYEPLQNVEFDDYSLDVATAAWFQLGFSYAYNVYNYLDVSISLGGTINKLWGYAGIYGEVNNANYIVVDDSTINIKNLDGQVGYALPVDYNTNELMSNPLFKGGGVGFDVGVLYVKKKYVGTSRWRHPSQQQFEDYIYKLGVSILDIGAVKYKHNAQLIDYNNVSAYWQNFDTISYDNVNQVVSEISGVFYGDPNASYAGNKISIGLPMAASLQFDYHYSENIYFGAFWIQPVRFNQHTLRRPAQLAIIPRYETKMLEISVPVSLYDYKYPRVGLAFRYSFFTIGTERLGTYLGIADLNGIDLYFSFKIGFGKGTYKFKTHSKCYNNEYGYSDKEKAKFRKN